MIGAEHERARPPAGAGFADAVTFAFADARADLCGLARAGIAGGEGSALAVLFSGRESVAAVARGGIGLGEDADWESLAVEPLRSTVERPLERWTVALAGEGASFDLTFEALGPPAELEQDDPVVRAGGMAGYEQLCRVTGTATVGGAERPIDCLGQRGHTWGEPDWSRLDSARTLAAWLGEDLGVALTTVRPASARGHDGELVWGALLADGDAAVIDDPRLSTTYDGEGHQRRAGLELWVREEDGYPRRAGGEVVCGSSLDLGQLRLDCAFFRWHMEGREGLGRYDVLRRA